MARRMTTDELVAAEKIIQGEIDQRAADQDAAMEAALLAGTLPDEDRRADPEPVVEAPLSIEDRINALPIGTTLERTGYGWDVRVTDPSRIGKLYGIGQDIAGALAAVQK